MEKDTHLVNIYLRIHNKKPLTMDDLRYLAQYAPECFEKTCQNVVYNLPATKPIMQPAAPEAPREEQRAEVAERQSIEAVLENIKRLETKEFPINNVDAEEVKSLLGNLYMELLFPHNDKDTFLEVKSNGNMSLFDRRV